MCACYTLGTHMQEIPEIEEKRVWSYMNHSFLLTQKTEK